VLHGCASSEHTEAEACLHGLRLTMEWIREPTWVESDCSTLINDIVNRNDTRSSLPGILSEIKAVGSLLPACKFTHVRRESISVAHTLAHRALKFYECVVMRYSFPASVIDQVALETMADRPCNQDVT
jgi:hypothetical protein